MSDPYGVDTSGAAQRAQQVQNLQRDRITQALLNVRSPPPAPPPQTPPVPQVAPVGGGGGAAPPMPGAGMAQPGQMQPAAMGPAQPPMGPMGAAAGGPAQPGLDLPGLNNMAPNPADQLMRKY